MCIGCHLTPSEVIYGNRLAHFFSLVQCLKVKRLHVFYISLLLRTFFPGK